MTSTRYTLGRMGRSMVCLLFLAALAAPCVPLVSAGNTNNRRRHLLADKDFKGYRFGTLRFENVQPVDGPASISRHVPYMLDALVTVHLDKVALVHGNSLANDWKMIEGQSLTMYWHQHFDDIFDNDMYLETLGSLESQLSGLHFCPLDGDRVLAINATVQAVQPLKHTMDVSSLVGSKLNVVVAHHATPGADGAHAILALRDTAH